MADGPRTGRGERIALAASSLVVLATLLGQAPGRIVPETKLDVLVDPVRYLGRALHAWDPSGGFGRVQNQAVGYLFPMGAWTALGHALHVPLWITQRTWIAAVVLVALFGAHRLARSVGIASPAGRMVAAWAYALAPATMATVAFQSAGQLPYSFAPWVLVPLVSARTGSSPRRTAARSALFVLAMGGVNGAAAFAVLPLVAVWFLTRERTRDTWRLLGWWVLGVVLATAWWLVPLLVSVRYGIRFTAFTETSTLTTTTESATEVLRGTGNWLSYLPIRYGQWLPGSYALATDRVAIVGSTLVAAGGVAGLARRDSPQRAWILPSAVLGIVAVGIGYGGNGGGSFATITQHLLDGPLAPFRNVHKFSAVVRLPLALGLGHLVSARWGVGLAGSTPDVEGGPPSAGPTRRICADSAPGPIGPVPAGDSPESVVDADAGSPSVSGGRRICTDSAPRRFVAVLGAGAPILAVLAIVLSLAPAAVGRFTAPGSFTDVPAAWRHAATWLDRHEGGRRTLILPGSGFGEYQWGRPLDEPLSSLLEGDWAVRDQIPLGGNGSTRVLDGIDTALLGDHLPDGFVSTLERAGVRYLLVRNDLDLPRSGGPGPASVERLMGTASGLRRAASFGRDTAQTDDDQRLSPRPTELAAARRELVIYAVPDAVDRVTSYPADGALVVGGGPEALLQLPAADVAHRATVLAVDEPAAGLTHPTRVATDTARRHDVIFGAIRNNVTYTLTRSERSPLTDEAPDDRWPADAPVGLSVARNRGAATITGDAPLQRVLAPEHQAGAAFDGSTATSWVPDTPATGHWLQVTFDRARALGTITMQLPSATGERIGSVTITTDHGSRTASFDARGRARVAPAPGSTRSVRITVATMVSGVDVGPVGLAEVHFGGMAISRGVEAAPVGRGGTAVGADLAVFSRLRRDRFDEVRTDEEGVLDRTFTTARSQSVLLQGTATATPGPDLDAALATVTAPRLAVDRGDARAPTATASSRWRDQPVFDATAALDGDPDTAWISAPSVATPTLRLSWPAPVSVRRIHLDRAPGTDAIDQVVVVVGEERITRSIPADGWVDIPATTTDHLALAFPRSDPSGTASRIVGLTEVRMDPASPRALRPARDTVVPLPCGSGPEVHLDGGRAIPTTAVATVGELLDGAPVHWNACEAVELDAGSHRVLAPSSGVTSVATLLVGPNPGRRADLPGTVPSRDVRAERWGSEHRTVHIAAGRATILATTENANDGWRATLDGRTLTPIRVDGWRQGWLVPRGGAGTVHLDYTPAAGQRAGLLVGALAVLALLGLALLPVRWALRRAGADRTDGTDRAWSAAGEVPWSPLVLAGIAALAGVALGGPAVLLLLPLLVVPHRERFLPWVAAVATVAAGAVAFAWPDAEIINHQGTLSTPAQVLATLAVLALAAAALPEGFVLGRRVSRRPEAAAGSTPSNPRRTDRRR